MTEPQKQDIVDKIIENTNVPVKPKPMVSRICYYVMVIFILLRNNFVSLCNCLIKLNAVIDIHYVIFVQNNYVISFRTIT